ncbi:unnamed protein product [Haemonchus placei]|uniref:Uncharacterized protein n=1 Tax=Haemonchus placei TaxID=6290 RepID=A0A0N4WSP7_HAEPC|nr:unnamed protein product [Haemonchus placei]
MEMLVPSEAVPIRLCVPMKMSFLDINRLPMTDFFEVLGFHPTVTLAPQIAVPARPLFLQIPVMVTLYDLTIA